MSYWRNLPPPLLKKKRKRPYHKLFFFAWWFSQTGLQVRFTHLKFGKLPWMISDFAFFHEDLRTETGLSIAYSKNNLHEYKIDVFVLCCFFHSVTSLYALYANWQVSRKTTTTTKTKLSARPTLFENFMLLQYNYYFLLLPYEVPCASVCRNLYHCNILPPWQSRPIWLFPDNH